MHGSIQMASHTIGQLLRRDSSARVALRNFGGLVVVAGITGVFGVRSRVAVLARHLPFTAVIQWEVVDTQQSRLPALNRMAVLAFQTKAAGVDLRLFMAARTIHRRTVEFLLRVAAFALQPGMFSFQWEEVRVLERMHAVYPVVALDAI